MEPAAVAAVSGRSLRILICEDQALTALHLRTVLQRLGYDVVGWAADGEEAVSLAVRLKPEVILMDVHMPRLTGLQALEQIMERSPAAVVMLTGCEDEPTIRHALEAGASGYLVKPFRDEQLVPAISLAAARFRELLAERAATLQSLTQAARQVEEADRRVEGLTTRLEREQTLARGLAESFLCRAPEIPGLSIETCYEPAFEWQLVGGDYFDFFELSEGRLGIAVGDACGKGVPAAGLTAVARYTLRAYALDDPSPARVVGRLNRALCRYTNKDCAFLTLVYGVLDLSSFSFTYTNAGHPAPVLWERAAGACRQLEPTGGLLGFEPDWSWDEAAVEIAPGGALALFSDGLTESGHDRQMWGQSGVTDAFCCLAAAGTANIAVALKDHASRYAAGRLSDDVVVVVLGRD